MTPSNKTYIVGGLLLSLIGLVFGLWYAIFVEHQTLESMGLAFAGSFTEAASRDPQGVEENLADFGAASYRYLREKSVHAHIIELGTLALIVPLFSHRIGWSEGKKLWLARAFFAGSLVFSLGVYGQTLAASSLGSLTRGMAVGGSGLAIACVGALALGLLKGWPPAPPKAEPGA